MINTETVLVLGAGAHMPYGFPSGQHLIDDIKNLAKRNNDLLKYCGMNVSLSNFADALRNANPYSIDDFLEQRSEFERVGKAAIVLVLLQHEIKSTLQTNEEDWFRFLFHKYLAKGTSFDEFDKNRLSVITFNYDRFFEHNLFTTLKEFYGKRYEECVIKLKNFPIFHIYGEIAKLPWQEFINKDKRRIPYGYDVEKVYAGSLDHTIALIDKGNDICGLIPNIKIIHEDKNNGNSGAVDEAKKRLRKAERIYFLGFGFHESSIKRLDLENLNKADLIYGTRHKLTHTYDEKILKEIKGIHFGNLSDQTAYDFLSNNTNAMFD